MLLHLVITAYNNILMTFWHCYKWVWLKQMGSILSRSSSPKTGRCAGRSDSRARSSASLLSRLDPEQRVTRASERILASKSSAASPCASDRQWGLFQHLPEIPAAWSLKTTNLECLLQWPSLLLRNPQNSNIPSLQLLGGQLIIKIFIGTGKRLSLISMQELHILRQTILL